MATTLDDLLALLPDNATGAIDAADLRQIVTALWWKSGGAGEVDNDGNLVVGPPGWTGTSTETGIYTITHNLGREDYSVAITPYLKSPVAYSVSVIETTANTFTYQVINVPQNVLHVAYCGFVLVGY